MNDNLDALNVARKTGNEYLIQKGNPLENNVIEFWQWACSDLASNTMRGIFAEYIVACALKIDMGIKPDWNAYDLVTKSGIKLEIKSAAYLQTWKQPKLSNISFDISPTKGWDASTNIYSNEIKRQADIYIFCLLKHQDKSTLNPLDLDQWIFYLLPTITLNEKKPNQQKIGLSPLLKLNPMVATFAEISSTIEKIVDLFKLNKI